MEQIHERCRCSLFRLLPCKEVQTQVEKMVACMAGNKEWKQKPQTSATA
jgi:hypothetical protein